MRARDGFTLLEVLVAMVILGFVIVGVQATVTDRMVRDVGWQEQWARATQLAMDRVHAVQADPEYARLHARWAGSEASPGGAAGFERTTRVVPVASGPGGSYTTVTVTVTAPRLPQPVARTVVIASP